MGDIPTSWRLFAVDENATGTRHVAAGGARALAALAAVWSIQILGCQPSPPEPPREISWDTATPESLGVSSDSLLRVRGRLAAGQSTALLVSRGGVIVFEWYRPGFSATDRHYGAGLAKSVVGGMALLAALDDSLLSLDDRAARYIPGWESDSLRSLITVRQLATHTSGIENPEPPGRTGREPTGWRREFWKRGGDAIAVSIREAPVVFEPGTAYENSGPGYAALSYAITTALQASPTPDIRSYLRERIMRPLGIPDGAWWIGYGEPTRIDGMDVYASWGGLRLTTRAAARIGQLLLQRGTWKGDQLVGSDWVERATTYGGDLPAEVSADLELVPTPGWHTLAESAWPEIPPDTFIGMGIGHQILVVVPSLDLVIVHFGETSTPSDVAFRSQLREQIIGPIVRAVISDFVLAPPDL